MARTIKHYLKSHPAPKRKLGARTATAGKHVSVGWAWQPDDETRKALARGTRKKKLAAERRHQSKLEQSKMATSKRKAKKTTAKKVTAKKVEKANGLMPLKKICQQLKIDPKMARRTLRADKAMAKIHAAKGRWEFTAAQAKKAKAVLQA